MDNNPWGITFHFKPFSSLEITPSSVIIAGDDCGGNLAIVTTLKVLMDRVVKKPDGLMLIYPWLNLTSDVFSPFFQRLNRSGVGFPIIVY